MLASSLDKCPYGPNILCFNKYGYFELLEYQVHNLIQVKQKELSLRFFSNLFSTWPISVAILILVPSWSIVKPTGSTASCGILNGCIFKSLISNVSSVLNE